MKQILLNIPDNHYQEFLNAIKNLDFIKIYNENDIVISEEEKKIILDRIKNSNPENGKDWNEIKDSFDLD